MTSSVIMSSSLLVGGLLLILSVPSVEKYDKALAVSLDIYKVFDSLAQKLYWQSIVGITISLYNKIADFFRGSHGSLGASDTLQGSVFSVLTLFLPDVKVCW